MNTLLQIRYYLEMIALPAFIFLVVHLSGHGTMLLMEGSHDHHHEEVSHGGVEGLVESFFTLEIFSGIFLLLFFTCMWRRTGLKKWVPCSHDHCHSELPISHMLAIIALCVHFFPEAGVRHELLEGSMTGKMSSILGLIGFGAHLLVDIIVAIVLSSYWKTKLGFWLSLSGITAVWLVSFFTAKDFIHDLSTTAEGALFIVSAFLLAMFIHKPHRPVACKKCD